MIVFVQAPDYLFCFGLISWSPLSWACVTRVYVFPATFKYWLLWLHTVQTSVNTSLSKVKKRH